MRGGISGSHVTRSAIVVSISAEVSRSTFRTTSVGRISKGSWRNLFFVERLWLQRGLP